MDITFDATTLTHLLARALIGETPAALRQASIEIDRESLTVLLRFEYDAAPSETAREQCACAATEVIADFPAPWQLDEQHVAVPVPLPLHPLRHVGYRRDDSRARIDG